MVKRSIYAALLTMGALLGSITSVAAQTGPEQGSWGVIQTYCFGCHNSKARVGGLALDALSPDRIAEDAQTWEAAIRKLRGGLMPPPGAKRPEGQSVVELISWLEKKIDAAATDSRPGRVALRRLNRREYAYVMRDLLGIQIDAGKLLPVDDRKGNFDNNAAGLQVSPAFVEQYVSAAREITRQALGDAEAPPVTATYGDVADMVISLPPKGAPGTGRQQHHIEGMPIGTRGGFSVKHTFPTDG
jgi:hypothetical protein